MIIIRLLLLSLCFTCVHCGLFSSSNPYISATTAVLYSNSSTIEPLESSFGTLNFKQNIVPNYNLTIPNGNGLEGVLYNAGLMCNSNDTNQPSLLQTQPKIALVLRGNCTFAEKAALVQANGASAMILYDNIPFEKDPYAGIMYLFFSFFFFF
ncbi:hypothetical protein J3Q64DRAFT_1227277 [Phycomyces blakesleeanus]|uniref:PA domain-containing protein n=1 Tax=Phycomyces blakesleeanus TaxID=4837 RepID=A0ABR3BA13_PHYBL